MPLTETAHATTRAGMAACRRVVAQYGLGIILAANIFGAGSIYILAVSGAQFGVALLWVLGAALGVGLGFHELSARLAAHDQPLITSLHTRLGTTRTLALAVPLALCSALWAVANYAIAGAMLVALLGQPLAPTHVSVAGLACALGASALVWLWLYPAIERASALLFGLLGVVICGLALAVAPTQPTTTLVPPPSTLTTPAYLLAVIALLGTTVYWPNFIIQSSMHADRYAEWTLPEIRRENVGAMGASVLVSGAFLTLAGLVFAELAPGALTATTPATAVAAHLGGAGYTLALLAIFVAAFASATGTMFAAGFMLPQARGHTPTFGDRQFSTTVIVFLLGAAMCIPLALSHYSLVGLAYTMPAVNGLVGLPVVFALLGWRVHRTTPLSARAWVLVGLVGAFTLLTTFLTARPLAAAVLGGW